MEKLRLAVIGCGAVVRGIHMPVAARSDQVEVAMLVDKYLPRARELADQYGVPVVADDYQNVVGQVDAAIVALPHYLHAPVTIDLLRHGIHVLVEKPMALTTSDCDQMIVAASNADATLAVGLDCRFMASSHYVKWALESGLLGDVVDFDLRRGTVYSWPVTSGLMFQKETAGGGVLIDVGVHALDRLLWWLGDYASVEYYDDAMGGVEANCMLYLEMRSGASGVMELSRTRDLRNSWIIRGEKRTLVVKTGANALIRLEARDRDTVLAGHAMSGGVVEETYWDVYRRQLEDFAEAIRDRREPRVTGQEGKCAVELVETCYTSRQLLRHPWTFPEATGHSLLGATTV